MLRRRTVPTPNSNQYLMESAFKILADLSVPRLALAPAPKPLSKSFQGCAKTATATTEYPVLVSIPPRDPLITYRAPWQAGRHEFWNAVSHSKMFE